MKLVRTHMYSDRAARGSQRNYLWETVVPCKLIHHPQGSVDSFEVGSASLDMAAKLHFLSDITPTKI